MNILKSNIRLKFSVILLYLFWAVFGNILAANYSGEIKSVVPHTTNFINFGPVFLNDTLQIKFFLKNTGDSPIKVNPNIPTFFLGLSPNDPTTTQWEIFRRVTNQPELPRTFLSGESDTVRINFLSGDTLITKTGWHEALLGLSFLPADIISNTPIAKIDTFFLRVKKTPYYVSGFEDDLRFDSVYINPNFTPQKFWRVKNVWVKNQPVFGLDRKLITQPFSTQEIIIADLPINPLEIYPDSIIYVPISYHPLNRGRDSMFLKMLYNPLKSQFPDSVDFAWTRIVGTGVEQEILIRNSNYNFSNDTIDVGNLKIGQKVSLSIQLINNGNIPFGIKQQSILTAENDGTHKDFTITSKFLANGEHLQPNSEMQSSVELIPSSFGLISARFRIESDILDRNIQGVQADKQYKYIYIKGNVVSPKIVLQFNEIDMGNVILSNVECPSQRDTLINIYNAGNSELIIYGISTNPPYPLSNFYPSREQMIIAPKTSDTLSIQFRVANGDFDKFESELILSTNQFPPFDSVIIKLIATSLPPVTTNLFIPRDLGSKPGSNIEVPIILSSNGASPATFAKSFRTSLFYNRSILEFNGIRTIGTATEGALNYGDNIEKNGLDELNLDIRTPANTYFSKKDTLVFLKFKTYLGNSSATEISFIEPKFGDGNCENIFSLIQTGGAYYTDSVCGLPYKAIPSINGKFDLNLVINSVSNDYDIEVELPYSTEANVNILDIFGQPIKSIIHQFFPSGKYQFVSNYSDLSSGLYFIELSTPAVRLVKPLPVIR